MVGELIWKLWKELIWEQAEKSKEVSCERGTKPELEIIDGNICLQQVDCCELGYTVGNLIKASARKPWTELHSDSCQ